MSMPITVELEGGYSSDEEGSLPPNDIDKPSLCESTKDQSEIEECVFGSENASRMLEL